MGDVTVAGFVLGFFVAIIVAPLLGVLGVKLSNPKRQVAKQVYTEGVYVTVYVAIGVLSLAIIVWAVQSLYI